MMACSKIVGDVERLCETWLSCGVMNARRLDEEEEEEVPAWT